MTKKVNLKEIETSEEAESALAELEGKTDETRAGTFALSGSAATGKVCML